MPPSDMVLLHTGMQLPVSIWKTILGMKAQSLSDPKPRYGWFPVPWDILYITGESQRFEKALDWLSMLT